MKQNNQDVIISCTRCASNVLIGHSTYDSSGKNLICFNCYNKIVRGLKPDRIIQSALTSDKMQYNCLSCGFKFSRSTSFHFGGNCFNCGKSSVQRTQTGESVVFRDRKTLLDY